MRKIKVTLQSSSRDQKQPAVAGGDALSAPGTPVLRTLGLTPCTPTRETPQRPPRLAGAGCQAAGQRLAGGGGFQVGLGALGPPAAQESSCPSRSQHCPHSAWGEPVCPQDATHGGWPVARGISIHSQSPRHQEPLERPRASLPPLLPTPRALPPQHPESWGLLPTPSIRTRFLEGGWVDS